ncbi:MAG: glycosyltransferase family 4 protein [Pseudarcicella sp.]|nr:glycosyltransferase family 4 protein [Pseudarcicella sp.]MBP6411193.1 glycosyltransferase family 4 protein [Pseudarcicella sp.]
MKILLINTDDFTGGAAIACRRIVKSLTSYTDIQAKILVQESKSGENNIYATNTSWIIKKIAWIRFVLERLYYLPFEKTKTLRFAFNPAKFGLDISNHKLVKDADILHLNWINGGFLSISKIGKLLKLNKPIVWTLHDMWAFTGGCHHSRECNNFQVSCGNCEQFIKNPYKNDLSNKIWNEKNKHFNQTNLTIVTCSNWLGNKAKQSSLFEKHPVVVIPNPIDTNVFKPMNKEVACGKLQISANKKHILFTSMRVEAIGKGYAYFEKAMNIIKNNFAEQSQDIEILIFGEAKKSDFSSLPFKVNILGKLDNLETIALAYSAAFIFVIPSLEENLPNTIMESMACGTPVVGFNVGGIPEMIDHKKTGYLAQYKSAEDLAMGIYWSLYQADYNSLSTNSRKKVEENYSEKIVAQKYQELYKSLIV